MCTRKRERDLYLFRLRFSHLSDWEDAEVKRNAWIQRIALMFFEKKHIAFMETNYLVTKKS